LRLYFRAEGQWPPLIICFGLLDQLLDPPVEHLDFLFRVGTMRAGRFGWGARVDQTSAPNASTRIYLGVSDLS
jgi:hypothetical protein